MRRFPASILWIVTLGLFAVGCYQTDARTWDVECQPLSQAPTGDPEADIVGWWTPNGAWDNGLADYVRDPAPPGIVAVGVTPGSLIGYEIKAHGSARFIYAVSNESDFFIDDRLFTYSYNDGQFSISYDDATSNDKDPTTPFTVTFTDTQAFIDGEDTWVLDRQNCQVIDLRDH